MLFYSNRARQTARDNIAELHVKLGSLPLNGSINLDDVRKLHMYLEILDRELAFEIKEQIKSEVCD